MRQLLMVVSLVAGCGDAPMMMTQDPPDLAPAPSAAVLAERSFRDAFRGQRYQELPALRAQLEAVYQAQPTDPKNTLLLALANLWTIAEQGRDPQFDRSQLPARSGDALRYLSEAKLLAPDDHRIEGWRSTMSYAVGRAINDPALIAAGLQEIDAGVAAFPEFNLFVRALLNGPAPIDQPELARAVTDLWTTLDLCAGEPVDHDHPDFAKYLGRFTTVGPQRACWNTDQAPHNFEGYFLYMGDVLVKANQPATARKVYANAQRIDSYGSWPFRAELEQRIIDADTRAARYRDADPANDPLLSQQTSTACASCHAAP